MEPPDSPEEHGSARIEAMLLVIDNYDSFTYNLVQYLGELGAEMEVFRNDEITVEEIRDLSPEQILISPGPGIPDNAGITLDAVREFAGKVPILGVCLGHQAIGQVFGGNVVRAPEPIHGKPSTVNHDGKGVFRDVAQEFEAGRYHSLVVDRLTFPDSLEVSAETEEGIIMGLRHKELPVEGVQFHPESILTPEGKKILKNFLEQSRAAAS
ncbi:MAG TPA: aminodeoxychorismate/anthranilate synthase component II [Aridibacter sp.]|nr:aminodeoxychorismate/anthranilate synthase component II [Aridibacter sp.]